MLSIRGGNAGRGATAFSAGVILPAIRSVMTLCHEMSTDLSMMEALRAAVREIDRSRSKES